MEYHKYACEGLNSKHESFFMSEAPSEPVSSFQHYKEDFETYSSSFNTPDDHTVNTDFVSCPLCQLSFPINLVERHASTCGE